MNDIRDLLPNRMRERTFQLKAKRDAGAVWHEPQFVEAGITGSVWCWITAASGNWTLTLIRRMC